MVKWYKIIIKDNINRSNIKINRSIKVNQYSTPNKVKKFKLKLFKQGHLKYVHSKLFKLVPLKFVLNRSFKLDLPKLDKVNKSNILLVHSIRVRRTKLSIQSQLNI